MNDSLTEIIFADLKEILSNISYHSTTDIYIMYLQKRRTYVCLFIPVVTSA